MPFFVLSAQYGAVHKTVTPFAFKKISALAAQGIQFLGWNAVT